MFRHLWILGWSGHIFLVFGRAFCALTWDKFVSQSRRKALTAQHPAKSFNARQFELPFIWMANTAEKSSLLHEIWLAQGPFQPGSRLQNHILSICVENCTGHGLRSSFRQRAAETTQYPEHVLEKALAHSSGPHLIDAYQRSDLFEQRRDVMHDWANYCLGE